MRSILFLALVGCAAYAAALPVKQEDVENWLTLREFEEVVQDLDLIDHADETYGFGKKLRKGLKKVGRGIEKGAKKILEKGLSWNMSVYTSNEVEDDELTVEEIQDILDNIEKLGQSIDAKPEFDTTYGFGKKLRKGLKKIGKALEKGGKKILEKGVTIPIPIPISVHGNDQDLSLADIFELLDNLEDLEAQPGFDASTYGLGRKLRQGLKKVGRSIEKVVKKVLEVGTSFEVKVDLYAHHEERVEDDIKLSPTELKDMLQEIKDLNAVLEELGDTYGFGKKLRKGLKKVGKALEKAGKKVLEKGITIPIPIPISLHGSPNDLNLQEVQEILEVLEAFDGSDETADTTYGFGKKLRKGLKKIGKALEKGAKKILEKGVSVTVPLSLNGQDGLSLDEVEEIARFFEELETRPEEMMTYGFGKKLRKGLKKIGRKLEEAGKKALERGFGVTVPI